MSKFWIKISFTKEGEKEEFYLENEQGRLTCNGVHGDINLRSIKEFVELEKQMWDKRGNRKPLDERCEIVGKYEEETWFSFEKFVAILYSDGTIQTAIDRANIQYYENLGKTVKEFYRPEFYKINLYGNGIPQRYWVHILTNCLCSNFSAELVPAVKITENKKITW